MSEPWSLPGYDVEVLLGFGATGEVWRARELSSGDTVALKRLRAGADPAALASLRREAALLRTLDTPYVVRLRAVVGDVLVLDHAPGGSLAALLARRGRLEPGEVVTVAAPLASGLAAAHALDLVHGDVSPANVLLTAEGMPLLADLGVARVTGQRLATVEGTAEYVDPAVAAGGEPDAAADVWALAALCHHLLAGSPPHDGLTADQVLAAAVSGARAPLGLLAPHVPRALVEAVEAGLRPDPRQRPDAAAFSSMLSRAHGAAPLRLAAGPPLPASSERETHVVRTAVAPPAGGRASRRRRSTGPLAGAAVRRGVLPALALTALVLLAAGAGWLSARGPGPAAASVPAAGPPSVPGAASGQAAGSVRGAEGGRSRDRPGGEPDWALLLAELDTTRATAFAEADAGLLGRVWAPGSSGLLADTEAVRSLAAEGSTVEGLRHTVRSLDVRARPTSAAAAGRPGSADPPSATLRVIDVLAGHEVRRRDGGTSERVPARPATAWLVSVVLTPDGWRLASVSRE